MANRKNRLFIVEWLPCDRSGCDSEFIAASPQSRNLSARTISSPQGSDSSSSFSISSATDSRCATDSHLPFMGEGLGVGAITPTSPQKRTSTPPPATSPHGPYHPRKGATHRVLSRVRQSSQQISILHKNRYDNLVKESVIT